MKSMNEMTQHLTHVEPHEQWRKKQLRRENYELRAEIINSLNASKELLHHNTGDRLRRNFCRCSYW